MTDLEDRRGERIISFDSTSHEALQPLVLQVTREQDRVRVPLETEDHRAFVVEKISVARRRVETAEHAAIMPPQGVAARDQTGGWSGRGGRIEPIARPDAVALRDAHPQLRDDLIAE